MICKGKLHNIFTPRREKQWLLELHEKLWKREDLRPNLFRKVDVTIERYNALVQRLQELHPNRALQHYDASASNVLTVKLECLQSVPSTSPDNQPPRSDNDAIDSELYSFLPNTMRFLDLSHLRLKSPPPRLPLPLLIRDDYDVISGMIDKRSKSSTGSVVVSGQPGTGKA
jgi:hypothetical protein